MQSQEGCSYHNDGPITSLLYWNGHANVTRELFVFSPLVLGPKDGNYNAWEETLAWEESKHTK
jgi:hypothetical protein